MTKKATARMRQSVRRSSSPRRPGVQLREWSRQKDTKVRQTDTKVPTEGYKSATNGYKSALLPGIQAPHEHIAAYLLLYHDCLEMHAWIPYYLVETLEPRSFEHRQPLSDRSTQAAENKARHPKSGQWRPSHSATEHAWR